MAFSSLDLIATILFLVAIFGWVNVRFLRMPISVGLLVIGFALSVLAAIIGSAVPGFSIANTLEKLLGSLNFSHTVLNFLLAFLMFAAGMSVDVGALRRIAWTAGALATFGTLLSTIIVGGAFFLIANAAGPSLSLPWCLVFGALISPTDPAALLASIRKIWLPPQVRALVQGESLFNDGVGIVLFTSLLGSAASGSGLDFGSIAFGIVKEGGAGVLLGAAAAIVALRAMQAIDDYTVETAITVAVATVTYAAANHLGLSGPIATATAGLIVGTERAKRAMSEITQRYVRGFWQLVEEILNATLFLLIGLEVVVVEIQWKLVLPALCAIILVLLARFLSVSVPAALLARSREAIGYWIIPILGWSGVRGGVSIALALALPQSGAKAIILAATYAVVLFSILVQSTTIRVLIRRLGLRKDKHPS